MPLPDLTVKYFDSAMSGAPVLSNAAGSLISVLNACLVNGFGSVTLTSLVIANNVATATVNSGHGIAMIMGSNNSSPGIGAVISVAGATPSALNKDWRIASVISASQFTFLVSGIADQVATGTITVKRSPLGWTAPFANGNTVVYLPNPVSSSGAYLRIADGTSVARGQGYEVMSSADVGVNAFPLESQMAGGGYILKATGSQRAWTLIGNDSFVCLLADYGGDNSWYGGFVFGDLIPYGIADFRACAIVMSSGPGALITLSQFGYSAGSYLCRNYLGQAGAVTAVRYSHGVCTSSGVGGEPFPSPYNTVNLWPIETRDSAGKGRGLMPGMWCPVHDGTLPDRTLITDIPQINGHALLVVKSGNGRIAFDISGPWR